MHIVGIVVFFAVVIFIKLKMPVWKGKYSEKLVNNKIQELPEEYVVFNDLLFESNGYSTQIDHIVVSPYGVFVIETKGYKGWILGGENSEYWTQTIYKSKHQFYNPIKQNAGHVRFLHHLLKCSTDILFIPIVVLNNSAELKVHADNNIVVNRYNLKRAILQYRTAVLNQETINWIIQTINQNRIIADKEKLKQHKHNAKARQYRSSRLINQGVCPQCGGHLILRKGKYGTFYGCSNFPTCKFTINS